MEELVDNDDAEGDSFGARDDNGGEINIENVFFSFLFEYSTFLFLLRQAGCDDTVFDLPAALSALILSPRATCPPFESIKSVKREVSISTATKLSESDLSGADLMNVFSG